MKSTTLLAAALCVLTLPGAASAQFAGAKPYVRVDGGWVLTAGGDRNVDFAGLINNGSGKGLGSTDDGALVGIGAGIALPMGVRGDVQFTYRWGLKGSNSASNIVPKGAAGILNYSGSAKTDISSFAMMANGYYDIKTGTIFTPYLGAGIGFASNKSNDTKYAIRENIAGFDFSGTQFGRRTTSFAWSLMAGGSVDLMQGLALDVGYRYFDGGKIKSFKEVRDNSNGNVAVFDTLSQYVRLHELTAGLRYSF